MKRFQESLLKSKIESVSQDSYPYVKGMLNAVLNPICYKNKNGVYLGVNETFARLIAGMPEEEIVGYTLLEVARKVTEKFPERASVSGKTLLEHAREWERDNAKLLKYGGTLTHEYEGICADGIKRIFLANKSTFSNEYGEILGLVTVLQDITELKESRRNLQESEERYRKTTKQTGQVIYDFDIEMNKMNWAGAIDEVTGYTAEEFENVQVNTWLELIHIDDRKAVLDKLYSVLENGGKINQEFRFKRKDGRYIYIEERGICLVNESKSPYRIFGAMTDVTQKKKIEENLVAIENARKKETHHRIKNNLQVISSLLDLQAEKFRDKDSIQYSEVLEAFRESQDRVTSIALIHEELQEGGERDTLNFSLYLERLIKSLFQTYRLGNIDINLNTDLEENISLDMDAAVPLGLIVNELVSNSLKHAFTGRKTGKIKIILRRAENIQDKPDDSIKSRIEEKSRSLILIVSDDGVGIPVDAGIENSSTLGLQLVYILVAQLEGKIEIKRNNGTEFIIKINVAGKS